MKISVTYEPHDAIPPKIADGFKRALKQTLVNWGIPGVVVTENPGAEMDAYRAWFDWNEKRLAEENG